MNFSIWAVVGVDYTGEHRAAENSTNYTLSEYCLNIVETVRYAMDEAEIPHPVIITEAGVMRGAIIHVAFQCAGGDAYDSPEPVWRILTTT